MSAIGVLFLLLDGTIHVLNIAPVVKASGVLGWPPELAPVIGTIELVCVALYVFPTTAPIGAVLLTGFLGGAVATQVRVAAPFFGTQLFPIYLATFLWGGLILRDARARGIFTPR